MLDWLPAPASVSFPELLPWECAGPSQEWENSCLCPWMCALACHFWKICVVQMSAAPQEIEARLYHNHLGFFLFIHGYILTWDLLLLSLKVLNRLIQEKPDGNSLYYLHSFPYSKNKHNFNPPLWVCCLYTCFSYIKGAQRTFQISLRNQSKSHQQWLLALLRTMKLENTYSAWRECWMRQHYTTTF